MGPALTLLTCAQALPGSNLGRETVVNLSHYRKMAILFYKLGHDNFRKLVFLAVLQSFGYSVKLAASLNKHTAIQHISHTLKLD
jgi:hypothetical protein